MEWQTRSRQEVAEKKRQVALQEKGIGKPRLRIARELSKKQALRLERGLFWFEAPSCLHSSRGHFHFHSFQGSFFPENCQNRRGNSWFLKRTMVERNGDSTPRLVQGSWTRRRLRYPLHRDGGSAAKTGGEISDCHALRVSAAEQTEQRSQNTGARATQQRAAGAQAVVREEDGGHVDGDHSGPVLHSLAAVRGRQASHLAALIFWRLRIRQSARWVFAQSHQRAQAEP